MARRSPTWNDQWQASRAAPGPSYVLKGQLKGVGGPRQHRLLHSVLTSVASLSSGRHARAAGRPDPSAGRGAGRRGRALAAAGGKAPGLLGRVPLLPVVAADLPALPGGPAGGTGELAKYGLPGVAQLRSRESYVLSYDPRTRGALWVLEQLRPERLRGDGDRSACDFREDDSVHAYHRATNADYRGSGFDRGHLAAAANHRWSQRAMDDTFYLSNVAPQVVSDPGRPPDCSV